jgi:hypothetical protein
VNPPPASPALKGKSSLLEESPAQHRGKHFFANPSNKLNMQSIIEKVGEDSHFQRYPPPQKEAQL